MLRLFISLIFVFNIHGIALAQSFGDDLCPKPENALQQTPDDLAGIQSDIERFSLCVRRAELLESLNKLAKQNTDSLIGAADIERITEEAFKSLPPVAPSDIGFSAEDFEDSLNDDALDSEDEVAAVDTRTPWLVNDIYGAGGNLRARITSKDGEIANIREGDVLPDGLSVYVISKAGITLKDDQTDIFLDWAR